MQLSEKINLNPTSTLRKLKITLCEFFKTFCLKKNNLKTTTKIVLQCIKLMKNNLDDLFFVNKIVSIPKHSFIIKLRYKQEIYRLLFGFFLILSFFSLN